VEEAEGFGRRRLPARAGFASSHKSRDMIDDVLPPKAGPNVLERLVEPEMTKRAMRVVNERLIERCGVRSFRHPTGGDEKPERVGAAQEDERVDDGVGRVGRGIGEDLGAEGVS